MNDDQKDEAEALQSIYDGDDCFKVISDHSLPTFQYKCGEDGCSKSFLFQIQWPPSYPTDAAPICSLDLFYNAHLLPAVKESLLNKVAAEAESLAGMAATFSLIDYVKENIDELLADQPLTMQSNNVVDAKQDLSEDEDRAPEKEKKQQLTKAQKRKLWDRGEANENDKPRGYNWVDVYKHLHQTGGAS